MRTPTQTGAGTYGREQHLHNSVGIAFVSASGRVGTAIGQGDTGNENCFLLCTSWIACFGEEKVERRLRFGLGYDLTRKLEYCQCMTRLASRRQPAAERRRLHHRSSVGSFRGNFNLRAAGWSRPEKCDMVVDRLLCTIDEKKSNH